MLRAVVHVFTVFLFFFNDPATPEIYTLSLHDALPICWRPVRQGPPAPSTPAGPGTRTGPQADRKSGSAGMPRPISYAVFCLQNTATHLPVWSVGQRSGRAEKSLVHHTASE